MNFLDEAQAGNVLMVGIAYVHADGDIVFHVSDGKHKWKLVGAIEAMKHAIIADAEDEAHA